jgi:dolichol-phosphate mannosyltransferase
MSDGKRHALINPALINPDLTCEARSAWQVPTFATVMWHGRRHPWCVVIPTINEGERLKRLLARMRALAIADMGDIVIVDGGSTDGSLAPESLEADGVRGLLLKTGPGKLSAQLRCAYAFALDQGYRGIVTIDGNNKDDPKAIPQFIDALKQGFDFVQASRFIPGGVAENTPTSRHVAIRWIHAPLLSLCAGFHWTDTTQGFRAYSRKMLLDSKIAPFRDVFVTYELLAYLSYRAPRLGYRCMELPTIRRYPKGEIPTKISSVRGNVSVLAILIRACTGHYDPD